LDADINLVTGATLKLCSGWPGVVVESVLRPSKLIETSEVSEALRAIWASLLPLEHKKFLPNKAVGLAGRRYNTSESTLLFRDAAEARHFKAQFIGTGSQLVARTVGDEVLYFVHHCLKAELVDGFYPVQHWVYDWVRRALFLRAREVGRPMVAVKTDALWFAGAEPAVDKQHTFEGIGGWGIKAGKTGISLPSKVPVIKHVQAPTITTRGALGGLASSARASRAAPPPQVALRTLPQPAATLP
jgi:hypothetical protein